MEVTNKQYYHCSVCGRTSVSKEKIEECETSHIQISNDKPLVAEYGRSRNKYPAGIGVPMQNGKTAWYQFSFVKEEKTQ